MGTGSETSPPWFALATLSLVGGAAIWLLGVWTLYVHPDARRDTPRLDWEAPQLEARVGVPVASEDGVWLSLDAQGLAAVVVPAPGVDADAYPYLQLRTDGVPSGVAVSLLWQAGPSRGMRRHQIPHSGFSTLWVSAQRVPGWTGALGNLGIGFQGEPGQRFLLRGISLSPPSLGAFLGATLDEWGLFRPWQPPSINAFTGSGMPGPSLYPAPAAAALLLSSLLVYGALLLLRRTTFDWRVPAALFLIGWLALDVPWQWRLWRQLGETHELFAGRSGDERRRAAPDGALYAFVNEAKGLITDPAARVFLATGSDYYGVRGAYHLFPLNVFWRRHGSELPEPDRIRPGDYVLVYAPRQAQYFPGEGVIRWSDENEIAVEQLMLQKSGGLFRVP